MKRRKEPRNVRRLLATICATVYLTAGASNAALAYSTGAEISAAKELDREITAEEGVVDDPLLNAWVRGVANRLWLFVGRKDVPYSVKILDSSEVNAFTTGGGYIYIDEGALDFVQSDDELAGVLGHETGHDERRHAVTLRQKGELLSILFGVASLFSPITSALGGFTEAGMMAKQSRVDELQADQYGLQLMTRAGFDPDAMLTFMQHLGAIHAGDDEVDRYFADHPGVPDRINKLLGYPALDPKYRKPSRVYEIANHDESEARYSIAAEKFAMFTKDRPADDEALVRLGEMRADLGYPAKAVQTLEAASAHGAAKDRSQAKASLAEIREDQRAVNSLPPNDTAEAQASVADTLTRVQKSGTDIVGPRTEGQNRLRSMQSHIQNISDDIPDLSKVRAQKNKRSAVLAHDLATLGRAVNRIIDRVSTTLDGVGSLESGRESGTYEESVSILRELASDAQRNPPPEINALLSSYPSMLAKVEGASAAAAKAVAAADSALGALDPALNDYDAVLKTCAHVYTDPDGEISQGDYDTIRPMLDKARASLDVADALGLEASREYNAARSRQLSDRLAMLGIGFPEHRFDALRNALTTRFGGAGLTFPESQAAKLDAGDVAASVIAAADLHMPPEKLLAEAKHEHRDIVDEAAARGVDMQALEIFLGLIYLDYTDDPKKEASAS